MKKIIVITIILLSIAACSSSNLSGLYQCKGPYRSLEFSDGKVIVDLGVVKIQGTYELSGHNVTLFIDGRSLVLESINDDDLNVKADNFMILNSTMIACWNDEVTKKMQKLKK